MASMLESLPPELQSQVLESIPSAELTRTLCSLSETSRTCERLATPLLYASFSFNAREESSVKLRSFMRAMLGNPEKRAAVKSLCFEGMYKHRELPMDQDFRECWNRHCTPAREEPCPKLLKSCVSYLLHKLPNVRILTLCDDTYNSVGDFNSVDLDEFAAFKGSPEDTDFDVLSWTLDWDDAISILRDGSRSITLLNFNPTPDLGTARDVVRLRLMRECPQLSHLQSLGLDMEDNVLEHEDLDIVLSRCDSLRYLRISIGPDYSWCDRYQLNFGKVIEHLKGVLETFVLHFPALQWRDDMRFSLHDYTALRQVVIDPRALIDPAAAADGQALAEMLPSSLAEAHFYWPQPDLIVAPTLGADKRRARPTIPMSTIKSLVHDRGPGRGSLQQLSVSQQWVPEWHQSTPETLRAVCASAGVLFGISQRKRVELENMVKHVSPLTNVARKVQSMREEHLTFRAHYEFDDDSDEGDNIDHMTQEEIEDALDIKPWQKHRWQVQGDGCFPEDM